jgi:hypothetical protein
MFGFHHTKLKVSNSGFGILWNVNYWKFQISRSKYLDIQDLENSGCLDAM